MIDTMCSRSVVCLPTSNALSEKLLSDTERQEIEKEIEDMIKYIMEMETTE